MRVNALLLAGAVVGLAGCATNSAPRMPESPPPSEPVPQTTVTVNHPAPKTTPAPSVFESQIGQLSSYMQQILVNNKKLAMNCVTNNKKPSCWSDVAHTVDQERHGIRNVAAATSCEDVEDLFSASDEYLKLAGKVARMCEEKGAEKCLSSAEAREAVSARQELRSLIGGSN